MNSSSQGFLFGLSSLFDVSLSGWQRAYEGAHEERPDQDAMAGDWAAVGGLLSDALSQGRERGRAAETSR